MNLLNLAKSIILNTLTKEANVLDNSKNFNNLKLFLTSWPNGSLKLVEIIGDHPDIKNVFYIRYAAGGTDTASGHFLFDLPYGFYGDER